MEEIYSVDKSFDKVNFKEILLPKGEYENCVFVNCIFAEVNLSDYKFTACEFKGCDLSLANVSNTAFREVIFRGCKMLGLRFDSCNQFGLTFRFEDCVVNHSSFYKTKIKKTVFRNSQLQETDFTQCDLSGAVFEQCDLFNASFENTILEKSDLRTALNYSIDPETNRIKKARFSLHGIPGLLNKYDIVIED
jgi:fluoroquinolone resistance protein